MRIINWIGDIYREHGYIAALNVPPGLSPNNPVDNGGAESVLSSEVGLLFALSEAFSQGNHYGIRCLSLGLSFTVVYAAVRSAFAFTVSHIVGLGSKKKMVRIDASRVVALVKNVHFSWIYSVVEFVTNAVRKILTAIYSKATIAVTFPRLPFPAVTGIAYGYVCPKTINGAWFYSPSLVMTGKKADGLSLDMPQRRIGLFGNTGFLSTSTVAVAIRNFVRGLVSGIIIHVISSFVAVTEPGMLQASPGISIGSYRCNYSTNTPVAQ